MKRVRHPQLLQINTRTFLHHLSGELGRTARLNDLPETLFEELSGLGYDYVWFLGVWQTGPTSVAVSRINGAWLEEVKRELNDFNIDNDITGSPFAVCNYTLHSDFGVESDLIRLKERLNRHNLGLILDFVPNHVGLDHPWISSHPEYFIQGSDEDLKKAPQNWINLINNIIFAHGKDPYFDAWTDTLQLNYRHQGLREAMSSVLMYLSTVCNGVRCDMSMLLLPSVIERTWGDKSLPTDGTPPVDAPFWPSIIPAVHRSNPSFLFIAEVYWDLEWELQQQGFDYTYDKRLYDRLLGRDSHGAFMHLHAEPVFMSRSVRFLENHDERRAAETFGEAEQHRAAAVITFCAPGMHFFADGQMEGYRSKISMHVGRRKHEPVNTSLQTFYKYLLEHLMKRNEVRNGTYSPCSLAEAWPGNFTINNFIAFTLTDEDGGMLLIIVNYADYQGQCYVSVAETVLRQIVAQQAEADDGGGERGGTMVSMQDLMSDAVYERDLRKMFVDMKAWGFHVFVVKK